MIPLDLKRMARPCRLEGLRELATFANGKTIDHELTTAECVALGDIPGGAWGGITGGVMYTDGSALVCSETGGSFGGSEVTPADPFVVEYYGYDVHR